MAAVHHLALRTADVPRLASFYGALFRAEPVRGSERSVWFSLDGEAVLMIEETAPGEPPISHGTAELIAYRWASTLAEARDHLRILGIPVEAATEATVYFRDPDGRRVALSTYDFAAALPTRAVGGGMPAKTRT